MLLVTERCLALEEHEDVAELSPQLVSSTPGFLGQSWMQALGIPCILMVQASCAVSGNVKKKCFTFL